MEVVMIKSFVSAADVALGSYPQDWFKKTLSEAEAAGFGSNNSARFSNLFFNGGKLNLNRELDDEYISKGVSILKAVMGSFEPKHEHKSAVCEYILASIEVKQ
jgi:hypothetical protein